MDDKIRGVLRDLVEYHKAICYTPDRLPATLTEMSQRAQKLLADDEKYRSLRTGDIDPFTLDVVGSQARPSIKKETEW
tara:strand:+ start:547 stop:780 length:234 start_codon:yes stop_codon:yes gene_type:complete